MAAIDYFLKLDGISGESKDSKHKGEIEVLSFSFGETQSRAEPGTGGRRRRRQGEDERVLLHGADDQGIAAALPAAARRASTSRRRS